MSVIYVPAARFRARCRRSRWTWASEPWSRVLVTVLAAAVAAWAISSERSVDEAATADATNAADAAAPPTSLAGRPTRITDGDTFRLGEVRVRLHGVDAPELRTSDGRPARLHLQTLIGSGAVQCDDTGGRSYERVVAVCRSAAGRELGRAMVEDGWAVDAPRFSGGRYAASERAARAARRGMHAAA